MQQTTLCTYIVKRYTPSPPPPPPGFVCNVRESVGRGAGDTRAPVHPPVVLLPPAAAVETDALEELPARDIVLHLLLYAAGCVAGELVFVRQQQHGDFDCVRLGSIGLEVVAPVASLL